MMKSKDYQKQVKAMFSLYGHDCNLENLPDCYEYGTVPDHGVWNKFQRWCIRATVVEESTNNVHVHANHLRSFGAIVKERRRQVLFYPYRIHPFSKLYTIWIFIMLLVILLALVTSPLEYLFIGLQHGIMRSKPWGYLDMFMELCLAANILITFFTGYYDEPNQEVVLDFKSIAMNYLKGFFLLDVLVISPPAPNYCYNRTPLDGVTPYEVYGILKFLLIVRFAKYSSTLFAEKFHVNFYVYMVSIVVVHTILFWHIVCSMLMYFRFKFGSEDNTLFKVQRSLRTEMEDNIQHDTPAWDIFISAIYRGSHIIYNSSHGKNLPSSEAEIIVIWLAWYGSLLFFIYILAMIMIIMTAKTSATHKYVEMERQLKDYMKYKQLPSSMRVRILTYYGFRFQKSYFRETDILSTISEQLRQEINLHACRKLVESVVFFRNLPLNLLVRIISCLKIEIYLVNDVIIKANTAGNSMYFISTGTVAVITKSGKEICHLEDGAHFGEIALIIKNTLRTASVVAVEVSEIYRLDQRDFVKAINPYPDLLANIQRIAAERMEVATMMEDHNKPV